MQVQILISIYKKLDDVDFGMMDKPHAKTARRIKWHRQLMGVTQREYAERAGLNLTQLSNWESGNYRISIDGALALREIYGLSLDFIYTGNPATLDMSLRKALLDSPLDRPSR